MPSKHKLSFAQALETLEKIVAQMEQSDVDLDKNLANFEHGLELIKICQKQLQQAKNKVKELQVKFSQETEDRDEKDNPVQELL